jgi:hypothetical protein
MVRPGVDRLNGDQLPHRATKDVESMTNVLLIVAYFGILLALTKPLGNFMYRLFNGERTFLSPLLRPLERGVYRLTGVEENREMRWTTYLVALLLFVANDVAKYFAIIPAMFVSVYAVNGQSGFLGALNATRLTSSESAILSAVIFNALIIVFLIPLALRGVAYRPMSAALLLRRNLLIYGAGGIIAPFIGIKLIDVLLTAVGLT